MNGWTGGNEWREQVCTNITEFAITTFILAPAGSLGGPLGLCSIPI